MAVAEFLKGKAGTSDNWNSHELASPEPGWVEVNETGWDGLKLWCAGPDNRARAPRDDRDRTVKVICETSGTRTVTFDPFAVDDLHIIEDSIDSYLTEAGVPPLPHGYRWYLRIPEWRTGDLLDYVDSRLNPKLTGSPEPADWLRELRPIIDDLYTAEPSGDRPTPQS